MRLGLFVCQKMNKVRHIRKILQIYLDYFRRPLHRNFNGFLLLPHPGENVSARVALASEQDTQAAKSTKPLANKIMGGEGPLGCVGPCGQDNKARVRLYIGNDGDESEIFIFYFFPT